MTGQRVALVTGAAGAIGGAITHGMIEDGWHVVAIDLQADPLSRAFGGVDGAEPYALDITDENAVDEAFAALVAAHGSIQAVVNNAGVTRDAALHKMTLEMFRTVISVNLEGTFLMCRAGLRHMRERPGGGRIVNISSMSARLGNFGQANYAASKAGVLGLTRVAAREGARSGVTVNAVLPGIISTPMTDALSEEVMAARVETIPVGRPGMPAEVAEAVRWLCSDRASYVTGTTLEVAGGRGL
jgi:NAD(P)-dependent dehydrogenase (short-subunit alcohol dehydrogenase family)